MGSDAHAIRSSSAAQRTGAQLPAARDGTKERPAAAAESIRVAFKPRPRPAAGRPGRLRSGGRSAASPCWAAGACLLPVGTWVLVECSGSVRVLEIEDMMTKVASWGRLSGSKPLVGHRILQRTGVLVGRGTKGLGRT